MRLNNIMPFRRIILSLSFLFTTFISFSQTGTIRGFVYDEATGEPIIFTNVIIKGTTTGIATDVNGYFSLPNIEAGKHTLVTNYLGYEDNEKLVEVRNGEISNVNIYMKEASYELDVVQINAKKQALKKNVQISSVKLTNTDIKRLPAMGGEADIAQYLQVVPGVVFSGEQGGQLYIRGGAPIQNKILIDGMPIYNAFHSIGVFSVFETDLIRNVDVITGGFGAEYGGRLSAVVDITTRTGNKKHLAGKFALNPFMAKAIIEGPIIKLGKAGGNSASYVLSYKHAIIDRTSQKLYSQVDSLPYTFGDFYSKVSFDSETGSKFSVFGFNFDDGVRFQNSNLKWNTKGIGTKFILVPTSSPALIEGGVSVSKYKINLDEYGEFARSSNIGNLTLFMNFKYYVKESNEIKYGFEVISESADYRFINAYKNTIEETSNTIDFGSFFKYKMIINKDLVLEPSIRLQRYNSISKNRMEPRFGMKYNVNNFLRFKMATGLYSQSLISAVSDQDVINLFTGFIFAPSEKLTTIDNKVARHSLQTAEHLVTGFEVDFLKYFEINVETYYKNYRQLININKNKIYGSDPNFMTEKGNAYGIDFLLKYDHKRVYFWGTYSIAFTKRKQLELDGTIYQYFPHFDRRHNINLLGSYVFGKEKNWEFGAKWNLGSGFPFTQVSGFYEKPNFTGGVDENFLVNEGSLGINYAQMNKGRLPYFHRLDLTIKKSFQLGEDTRLETNATVTNAYNRANIFYYDRINNKKVNQLPMIPSIGLSMTF